MVYTVVMVTPPAGTVKDRTAVPAIQDSLEMEKIARLMVISYQIW